jgi:hypothetical protein
MELYSIGYLCTLGIMLKDGSFEEKGFKNKLMIFCGLIIWPVLLGVKIGHYLSEK